MASSDPPVPPTLPKLRVDWSPNFTFSRKPPTQSPYSYSPSTTSPKTIPGPSHPGDHRQDPAPNVDGRLVASRRVMRRIPPSPLSPVRERSRPEQRHHPRADAAIDIPRVIHPGSTTPVESPALVAPTPSLADVAPSPVSRDGARSILLSGLSESEATRLTRPVERTESAPSLTVPGTPTTIHPEILQLREHLRSLGHLYLGSMSGADVLVQGVALRRNSLPPNTPTVKVEQEDDSNVAGRSEKTDHPSTPGSPKFRGEITVRARVRSRQPNRKSIVIQRKFNLDELRATIPDPGSLPPDTPTSASSGRRSSVADLGSPYCNSPSPSQPGFPSPAPLIGSTRRRSTSARYGPLIPCPRSRRGPASAGLDGKLAPRGPGHNIMPIHLEYARSYLPVLAAILLSGHVREGDIVDIPIPEPQAWAQAVEHVYTGRGELTKAVRENITYLGGKV
ncbi:uncharacterized protein DNG_05071 [Cephalotrichum gorgonifer]|uniref:Uncharacterized protein n=1 Tax=Cephalotrichum gorgonifer TaxID=2041049 RepID=A0AAE8SV58_9PEZI|nr:uncharacterized protein DNG_05071 [Cephalotrichum gorgonifer]